MVDIQSFLAGMQDLAVSLKAFMSPVALLTGITFGARGCWLIVKKGAESHGGDGSTSSAAIAVWIFSGAFLIGYNSFVSATMDITDAGLRASSVYTVVGGGATWDLAMLVATSWLGAIGVIGIYRGILQWVAAGSGRNQSSSDAFWSGLWHLIGGGFCLNLARA